MLKNSKYASKDFWVEALDRAVATFGQSALAVLTAGATGILDIDLIQLLSVSGLAVAASLATSIAAPARVLKGVDAETEELEAAVVAILAKYEEANAASSGGKYSNKEEK